MSKPAAASSFVNHADPVWDAEFYNSGRFVRAPYEAVASFVYRHAPARPRSEVRILELGCGSGNNVWFLASEGFHVAGTDASERAIEYARRRLSDSGLAADLRVAAFPDLPFADASFDLACERAALVYIPPEVATLALQQVQRVLVPGGKFFFNPYSGHEGSAEVGYTCYWTREMIEQSFAQGWKILRLHHAELRDALHGNQLVCGDWRVEVERTP